MRGKLKQNFEPNTRIIMNRTTSALDGQYGTIIGLASGHPECDFYIVQLDSPTDNGWTGIMLIESCIDRLSNESFYEV
jgi:hypothetical protein